MSMKTADSIDFKVLLQQKKKKKKKNRKKRKKITMQKRFSLEKPDHAIRRTKPLEIFIGINWTIFSCIDLFHAKSK